MNTLIVVAVGMTGLLLTQGWLLAHLRQQQQRVGEGLRGLEQRLIAAATPAVRTYRSQRAPGFALPGLDGGNHSLDGLLAGAKPLILFFTDPRCGACHKILPELAQWQRGMSDRMTIALISSGQPDHNRQIMDPHGCINVLLQRDHEVADAYEIEVGPAAVLVQPDGALAGRPAFGAGSIRELVADTAGRYDRIAVAA